MGFVEIIRGKYKSTNISHLQTLVDEMTILEKKIILEKSFCELWNTLWYSQTNEEINCVYSSKQKKEYKNSENRFYKLLEMNILQKCIEHSNTKWKNPEWGFPKGRRNLKESNLQCAKREFQEETNIHTNQYKVYYNFPCRYEIFMGSNNIRYKHIYYIAKINEDTKLILCDQNIHQLSEISAIGFFTLEECLQMIRPYSKEKKKILLETDFQIKKYDLENKEQDYYLKISNFNFKKNSV
jgi:8-oxo-dGTP pyrophosphatase MutT (NUDIX family)